MILEIGAKLLKDQIPGKVRFHIAERLQRICIWINQNFLLSSDIIAQPTEDQELKLLLSK